MAGVDSRGQGSNDSNRPGYVSGLLRQAQRDLLGDGFVQVLGSELRGGEVALAVGGSKDVYCCNSRFEGAVSIEHLGDGTVRLKNCETAGPRKGAKRAIHEERTKKTAPNAEPAGDLEEMKPQVFKGGVEQLRNVKISATAGVAIEVKDGCCLTLWKCQIDSAEVAIRISGDGTVRIQDCRIEGRRRAVEVHGMQGSRRANRPALAQLQKHVREKVCPPLEKAFRVSGIYHEVWSKILRNLPCLGEPFAGSWVETIARNTCIDRPGGPPDGSAPDREPPDDAPPPPVEGTGTRTASRLSRLRDWLEQIERDLDGLEGKNGDVFRHRLEGLSNAEVAVIMGYFDAALDKITWEWRAGGVSLWIHPGVTPHLFGASELARAHLREGLMLEEIALRSLGKDAYSLVDRWNLRLHVAGVADERIAELAGVTLSDVPEAAPRRQFVAAEQAWQQLRSRIEELDFDDKLVRTHVKENVSLEELARLKAQGNVLERLSKAAVALQKHLDREERHKPDKLIELIREVRDHLGRRGSRG